MERELLEKLMLAQLIKYESFHAFYGNRNFIAAFTGARH
jgi:hypothetical protein